MWIFWLDAVQVCFSGVRRNSFWQSDTSGRDTVIGRRQPRRIRAGVISLPFLNVDDLNLDCAFWTGIHASGFTALTKPSVTHVALTDHTSLGVILRNSVRTIPRTVLTANASVGAVW